MMAVFILSMVCSLLFSVCVFLYLSYRVLTKTLNEALDGWQQTILRCSQQTDENV